MFTSSKQEAWLGSAPGDSIAQDGGLTGHVSCAGMYFASGRRCAESAQTGQKYHSIRTPMPCRLSSIDVCVVLGTFGLPHIRTACLLPAPAAAAAAPLLTNCWQRSRGEDRAADGTPWHKLQGCDQGAAACC